ncbi:MAG TPA: glycoside hydrolase family 140 protein [Cyclobacteriaceae bacterium]|nr:glycoside hydrolase family 140 protein [Cyclobacteriaceae bacterium]
MKIFFYTLILFLSFYFPVSPGLHAQKLTISPDQRFIRFDNGKPFFYLGDTAWELFHRLSRDEADLYLQDRAAKGFTVIQAVVLAELDGLKTPNSNGDLPFIGMDLSKPNEKYFQHVDYIVDKAASLGMFIGMLPAWGDKWNLKWGQGPEIFNTDNAYAYGKFIGRRYRDEPIIWILGGDRLPENDEDFAIVRAMVKGLAEGDEGNHLMTYHPMGGKSSSDFFHKDTWLLFNFFQSGHGPRDLPNYEFIIADRNLAPIKPTMDGEPRYEDHPVQFRPGEYGWFDDFDTRQAAYWSMMTGACGHTYGNHNIWQMWTVDRKPVSWARTEWKRAIHAPGSWQVGFMKSFFEKYPWQDMIPDQSLILNFNPRSGEYQVSMISKDQRIIFAYTPYGKPLKVDTGRLKPGKFTAAWFNPRDGKYLPVGNFNARPNHEFTPHSIGRGSDWVLVLECTEQ